MLSKNKPVEPAAAPEVSVVMATYQRPRSLLESVQSALSQSFQSLEVLVVVDGPHEPTVEALATISDPRVRVIVSPVNVGQAAAINLAIPEARGYWIALLDDDDLWLPDKLERQMELAAVAPQPYPIISCQLIARTESRDFHWPRRQPRPDQSLDEYLFCRSWPTTGEGMVQNSTILTPTELLKRVPFSAGLKRYVDLDWLMRTQQVDGAEAVFVASKEPLVIWHIEENRTRVSNRDDWHWALSYIQERRHLMTARGYGAFVMTFVSASAAKQGDWSAFFPLLREAFSGGRPGFVEVLGHLANFCLPRSAKTVAAGLSASRQPKNR